MYSRLYVHIEASCTQPCVGIWGRLRCSLRPTCCRSFASWSIMSHVMLYVTSRHHVSKRARQLRHMHAMLYHREQLIYVLPMQYYHITQHYTQARPAHNHVHVGRKTPTVLACQACMRSARIDVHIKKTVDFYHLHVRITCKDK